MNDELATILRLVDEGHLTPKDAAPLVAALSATSGEATDATPASVARHLRIRVSEGGHQVVHLRVPLGVAEAALRMVPGLRGDQAGQIKSALGTGAVGPIIDVAEPNGDRVLISLE